MHPRSLNIIAKVIPKRILWLQVRLLRGGSTYKCIKNSSTERNLHKGKIHEQLAPSLFPFPVSHDVEQIRKLCFTYGMRDISSTVIVRSCFELLE